MRQDCLVDVESVSDELYGLPLEEFTRTRTVRENQAKSARHRDLALKIHQLAKPNLVAWLANQLVRERADAITPLLELGAGLREATATLSGEQLRELSRQQRQFVHALVQQARQLADAAGRKVSTDTERGLEATLRAALADPEAADALAAGRLTEGMQDSGLGAHTSAGESPSPSAKRPRTTTAPSVTARQPTPEQRQRAEHDVDQAKSAAHEAAMVLQENHELLDAADHNVVDAGARAERARRELDAALQAKTAAEKDQRRARAAFDRADRAARDAQRRLADASQRLDRLTP
jgi:hypothetical protein